MEGVIAEFSHSGHGTSWIAYAFVVGDGDNEGR